MADQPKLERLLRLLMMLSGSFGNSMAGIAQHLGTSQRTAYRYLETLRDAGFIITRNDNLIRVDKESPYLRDISDLLHFTREEAWILNRAILMLDDETYVKQSLARKLYALYDLKGVPYPVVKRENSEKVVNLIRAIENKHIVLLTGYQSSNSSTVADREVEPFEFTLNYSYIWCLDITSHENKLFKTARIGTVKILQKSWEHENDHKSEDTDIFRITGVEKIKVKLILTLRAANLLVEEYPMAEEFIKPADNQQFVFSGWVRSYEGIGRFILGLMDEVVVLVPQKLKTFLNYKIRKKKF